MLLEKGVILICFNYILETKTREKYFVNQNGELGRVLYFTLFYKLIALLPSDTIEEMRKKNQNEKLEETMSCMISAFRFNELILAEYQDSRSKYLETVDLIKNGQGIYCRKIFFCMKAYVGFILAVKH